MRAAFRGREVGLGALGSPLPLASMVPGVSAWEVEIGFGKGRYLLERAAREGERGFLGIEVSAPYYRLVRERVFKRRLENVILLRGEALYLLSAVLPREFAQAVHVYFPDPWPKARHRERRLLHPETADLLLALLEPGGRLEFATDFESYGLAVTRLLATHPAVELRRHEAGWPDGPRTNYERKYEREGRRIVRLEGIVTTAAEKRLLHPAGRLGIAAAVAPRDDDDDDAPPERGRA